MTNLGFLTFFSPGLIKPGKGGDQTDTNGSVEGSYQGSVMAERRDLHLWLIVAQIKWLGVTIIESLVTLVGGSEDLSNYYLIAELVLKNFSIIEFMHPLNRVAQLN